MAQKIRLNIQEIEQHYHIEEDGSVWSIRRGRYVRQVITTAFYPYVSLQPVSGMVAVQRLVAEKYLGECPARHEISHRDGNRMNNHRDNLEYVRHGFNQKRVRTAAWRQARCENSYLESVSGKMATSPARRRPVSCSDGRWWGSVNECAASIGKSRISIYTSIKAGVELKGVGGMLSYSPVETQK